MGMPDPSSSSAGIAAGEIPAAARARAGGRFPPFALFDPERRVRDLLNRQGIEIGGTRPWDVRVRDPRVYRDILLRGTIAAGEAYVDGRWDCDALDEMVARLLRQGSNRRLLPALPPLLAEASGRIANAQGGRRAREVIERHYDRHPEVIEAIIGPSLCYSCGYWAAADTLDRAQHDKLDLICRKLGLSAGDHVLDIGCGYGAFALHAARHYGCHVVGVTLSSRQASYARTACAGERVDIRLVDYQDPAFDRLGPFDKIVSIGMFEHVGRKNYAAFFRKCRDLLRDGGLMLLHAVGRTADAAIDPWVDRYVFPNGYLPTLADLDICRSHGLILEDLHNFGADYDRTLIAWHENLLRARRSGALELDDRTYRFWKYYLLTFAGAFRARTRVQLWQVMLSRGGVPGGYRRPA